MGPTMKSSSSYFASPAPRDCTSTLPTGQRVPRSFVRISSSFLVLIVRASPAGLGMVPPPGHAEPESVCQSACVAIPHGTARRGTHGMWRPKIKYGVCQVFPTHSLKLDPLRPTHPHWLCTRVMFPEHLLPCRGGIARLPPQAPRPSHSRRQTS